MADKDDSSKTAVPDTGQGGPGDIPPGVHGGNIVDEEENQGQNDGTDEQEDVEERIVDKIEGESTEGEHVTEQQENTDEMSKQRPPSRGRDIL